MTDTPAPRGHVRLTDYQTVHPDSVRHTRWVRTRDGYLYEQSELRLVLDSGNVLKIHLGNPGSAEARKEYERLMGLLAKRDPSDAHFRNPDPIAL